MSTNSLPLRRPRAAARLPRKRSRLERLRVTFDDGARTTLHVASYEVSAYVPRVVTLERPAPLARWCKEQGVRHAVVGGFFVRPQHAPLGQLQINGQIQPSVAFDAPWATCVRVCTLPMRRFGSRGVTSSVPSPPVISYRRARC
jgi:hypothetical protein